MVILETGPYRVRLYALLQISQLVVQHKKHLKKIPSNCWPRDLIGHHPGPTHFVIQNILSPAFLWTYDSDNIYSTNFGTNQPSRTTSQPLRIKLFDDTTWLGHFPVRSFTFSFSVSLLSYTSWISVRWRRIEVHYARQSAIWLGPKLKTQNFGSRTFLRFFTLLLCMMIIIHW